MQTPGLVQISELLTYPPQILGNFTYLRTWVRTETCPLFRTGRMLTAVGIVLCYWLLRIQPRNPGQKYPLPTLAMGADQNLSAFSDWQNANRRRNRAVLLASTHFSRGIQDRNLRSQPCPWVRTKTCPLFGVLIWHDGHRCPRSRKNFCRALLHQAARFMSMTGCRSGPREPSE